MDDKRLLPVDEQERSRSGRRERLGKYGVHFLLPFLLDKKDAETKDSAGSAPQEVSPALVPGVVPTLGDGQFSVNGQRDDGNYLTVDGASANVGISAFPIA